MNWSKQSVIKINAESTRGEESFIKFTLEHCPEVYTDGDGVFEDGDGELFIEFGREEQQPFFDMRINHDDFPGVITSLRTVVEVLEKSFNAFESKCPKKERDEFERVGKELRGA